MILYHFPTSPFSRRVRLALALKGIHAELRDARANPEFRAESDRLNPMHTVPVLVDDARVIVDSFAICEYIDKKTHHSPLWPTGLDAVEATEFVALTDSFLHILLDLGLHFHSLNKDSHFEAVRIEMMGRAQRTLDFLGTRVSTRGAYLCGGAWSAADIAVFTTIAWLEGLPGRAASFPLAKQILDLGWTVPPALTKWADHHRKREDVLALG